MTVEKSARAATYAIAAAIMSVIATFVAALLYLRIALGEPFRFSQAGSALAVVRAMFLPGILVVAVPAALLGWNRERVSDLFFAFLGSLLGAISGFAVAWLVMRNAIHVSFAFASTLMTLTWTLGGSVLALIGRSPRFKGELQR